MARRFSRRDLVGAGGLAALAPMVPFGDQAQASPLPFFIVPPQPVRVFDSRTTPTSQGGGKLATGNSVTVSIVSVTGDDLADGAAFVNVTITDTEGSGFLVVRAAGLPANTPLPSTSNLNWTAD